MRRFAVLLITAAPIAALTVAPTADGKTVDVLGAVVQEKKCCGHAGKSCPGHVPDIPARVFYDRSIDAVRMIVGSTAYFPMSGPTPLRQDRSCAIAFNKTADPDPSHFASDEYLDSPFSFGNGTVISLVHTEFPGNKYNHSGGPDEPYCTIPGAYPHCWTVSIGLAVSHDWGQSFEHVAPPPHHLVAAVPSRYNQSQLASGWGDPSNILRHPTDGYYYAAIWNRHQVGLQPPGICMMRTNRLLDPRSWRGWSGSGYTVAFADPYDKPALGAAERPVCMVTNLPAGRCKTVEGGCAAHGLFWSAFLQKFVVTLGCNQAKQAVFKVATSDDLISWSAAAVLMNQTLAKAQSQDVILGMNYPTFIDPGAPKRYSDDSFGVIGQHPYLFWVSIGDNPEDIGRHLLATPFTFLK